MKARYLTLERANGRLRSLGVSGCTVRPLRSAGTAYAERGVDGFHEGTSEAGPTLWRNFFYAIRREPIPVFSGPIPRPQRGRTGAPARAEESDLPLTVAVHRRDVRRGPRRGSGYASMESTGEGVGQRRPMGRWRDMNDRREARRGHVARRRPQPHGSRY
jgi:hypothetical protein